MRHGTHCRHAEQYIRHGTGGGGTAADIGSPGAVDGTIIPLSPTGAEFHHRTPMGCPGNAVGLGGNERLMVDGEQQHGFQQLRLHHRAPDDHHGFVGKDRCALGYRPYIAFKMEVRQIVQELLAEDSPAPQVGNVLLIELQILHVVDELLQARKDGKAAIVRNFPEKHIKHRNGVLPPALEITIRHGELIKVNEHRQIAGRKFFLLHVNPSIPVFRYTDGRSYETASRCVKPVFYYIPGSGQCQSAFPIRSSMG